MRRDRRQGGFTVLEILIAAGLMVVLVALMLSLTTTVLRAWNRTTANVARDAQATQSLAWLQEDFAMAVRPGDSRRWLRIATEGGRGWSIRFLRPRRETASAQSSGELEMVEWALAPRDRLGAAIEEWSTLFRATVPDAEWRATYADAAGLAEARPLAAATPDDWWNAFLFSQIVDARVEIWIPDPASPTGRVELRSALAGADGAVEVVFPFEREGRVVSAPVLIEIHLQVLSAEGARRYALALREGGDPAVVVLETGRSFVSRLMLEGGVR